MSLRDRWETHADAWISWARAPNHDSFWRHHRDQFLAILPPPDRLTVDIGCGEGRLARHLRQLGYAVVGIDASPSLVAAARATDPSTQMVLADAAALPVADGCADLAIAFMSLQDVDDMPMAVREAARILRPGGRFCLAIVHPLNSAGRFASTAADAPFVIKGDYLRPFGHSDVVERDGLRMTFHSRHRSLESYFSALEEAGFLIETLKEPEIPDHAFVSASSRRWQRVPLFLHLRARRSAASQRA
jgi:SAM-dependent methyltransferase